MSDLTNRGGVVLLGGGLLGFGLGGFVDVLVFHLVLQWHHLLSSIYAPTTLEGLRRNLYFDGIFSLAMVALSLLGGALIWRAVNGSDRRYSSVRLLGSVLVGVGAFNLFDGIVDHYVLGVHDVVHGTRGLNPHWVGASLLLVGIGVLVLTR